MTGPAVGDDVVSGCVQWLRADPTLGAWFANPADPDDPFISDDLPDLGQLVDGQALVITWIGPAGGSDYHTYDQVRLQAELWAVPPAGGDPELGLCRRRLFACAQALDAVLHRPQGGAVWWGEVRTTDCLRLASVQPYEVPQSDGRWRGFAVYAVGLG